MLRYQGKPFAPANVQVDKFPDWCRCEFVAVGVPLLNISCTIHQEPMYSCDICKCSDYRPSKPKTAPGKWPRCTCGHIAQDHN